MRTGDAPSPGRALLQKALGAATMALLVATAVCRGQEPMTAGSDPSAVDAARLYASACATCHGHAGRGDGRAARHLDGPAPRDFTTGVFKFRSTPAGIPPTDEDLFRAISRGVPGTWMPAWEGLLTRSQRWALVRYVKGFSSVFTEEAPEPPSGTGRDGAGPKAGRDAWPGGNDDR